MSTKRSTPRRKAPSAGKAELAGALSDLRAAIDRAEEVLQTFGGGETPNDEDASDLALLERAEAESAGHEPIPGEVADRLFAGHNPVKVFRDWRGLKQRDLAELLGISQGFLSEIESGKPAAAQVYRRIADLLHVSMDLIIPTAGMTVFKLVPRLLHHPDWQASTWKRPVVVRASSERAARWAASLAFGIATPRRRGRPVPVNPWRQADMVEAVTMTDGRWSQVGPVEILDPPHHNEALVNIDWDNL
jgi:transcriptional regulator with XRE-family HTH domain